LNDKNEYKTISKRAKELLEGGEDIYVDYKIDIKGFHMDDFVAFANSQKGGAVLIGVKEIENSNGSQCGKIEGCSISDGERLKLVNKSSQCSPIVEFSLIIENSSSKPFYRVEIPSGEDKPYCTSKGAYLIRGNGRNLPLLPNNLLNIFLEVEGGSFIDKFKNATDDMSIKLKQLLERIKTSKEIQQDIYNKSWQLEDLLEEISGVARNAEDASEESREFSDEALSKIEEIEIKLDEASGDIDYIIKFNKALCEKLGIEDPAIERIRIGIRNIVKRFSGDNKKIDEIKEITLEVYSFYEKKIIEKILNEEIKR